VFRPVGADQDRGQPPTTPTSRSTANEEITSSDV